MKHPIYRVTSFNIVAPFTLDVKFDDGSMQRIDFQPVLHGKLYGPLSDPELFAQVTVDPEVHTLVWPNGADYDPATLHDWSEAGQHMAAMARRWSAAVKASHPPAHHENG